MASKSNTFIYAIMVIYVMSGSFNILFLGLQNSSEALGHKFHHPWLQTLMVSIAELFCLFVYGFMKLYKARFNTSIEFDVQGQIKQRPNRFIFLVVAILDLVAQFFLAVALVSLKPSIYSIFKGLSVILAAVFSVIFFKRVLHRQHYLGLFLILLGVSILALYTSNVGANHGDHSKNLYFGYMSMTLFIFFFTFQLISEEGIFLRYKAHPIEVAGYQGLFGSVILVGMLFIFQHVECSSGFIFRESMCVEDDKGLYLVENSIFAFQQMKENLLLIFYCMGFIVSTMLFNMYGNSVTKFCSAAQRVVIDNLRPVVIYILCVMFPIFHQKFTFSWSVLCAYCIVLFGVLIYNEIIVVKWCSLGTKTEENLKNLTIGEDIGKEEKDYLNYKEDILKAELEELDGLKREEVYSIEGLNSNTIQRQTSETERELHDRKNEHLIHQLSERF